MPRGKPRRNLPDGRSRKDSAWCLPGLIDSLSVLKLIALLEKKLHVTIPPETLQPEDFDDLDLIVETVRASGQVVRSEE